MLVIINMMSVVVKKIVIHIDTTYLYMNIFVVHVQLKLFESSEMVKYAAIPTIIVLRNIRGLVEL